MVGQRGLKPADRRRPDETRDALWRAIRRTGGESFRVRDIARGARHEIETIREYLAGLARAGYLERTSPVKCGATATYRLVRDSGAEAPRVRRDGTPVVMGRGREQMWRTMRILGDFSARELAVSASTEDVAVAETEARTYCTHLHRAGYLVLARSAKPGHRAGTGERARYRMLRSAYTGPKPPQVQRNKQVYDPNLRQVVWPAGEPENSGGAA